MRPVMETRAIAPPGWPVSSVLPGMRNAAPSATTAPMASTMARTRQNVSLRRMRRRSTMVSASSDISGFLLFVLVRRVRLLGCALECRAENIAERGAGIGGTVLCDRLLFLRHFERLDRDLHLVGAAIELDDAGVDLLTYRKTLRPLLAAIARELRTLDESG